MVCGGKLKKDRGGEAVSILFLVWVWVGVCEMDKLFGSSLICNTSYSISWHHLLRRNPFIGIFSWQQWTAVTIFSN